MNTHIKEVSETLRSLGLKMAAEGRSITLNSAAAASCILLAKLQQHVTREEFTAACTLQAALLNSHATVKMMEQPQRVKCDGNHGGPRCSDPECWNDAPSAATPRGRTVTETVESGATGQGAS